MAFDQNGRYIIPQSSWYKPQIGVSADPSDWQALIEDVANALTMCLKNDGRTPIVGDLNMSGYRVRGVGSPIGNDDAINRGFLGRGSSITRQTILQIPSQGTVFDVKGSGTTENISMTFAGRFIWLRFDAGITLKNSSSLRLIGETDWLTNENDIGLFLQIDNGVWQCVYKHPLGSAAYRNTGQGQNDIPLNSDLGDAAYRDVGTDGNEIRINSQNDARFIQGGAVAQAVGNSDIDVMSQKAVTDALNTKASKGEAVKYLTGVGVREFGGVDTSGGGSSQLEWVVDLTDNYVMTGVRTKHSSGSDYYTLYPRGRRVSV